MSIKSQTGTAFDPFGDKHFEQLFQDTYEPLCRYALRFTRNEEEAEDIVQEQFAHIWEHRERLQPGSSVRAYMYTAVKNRSINHLKKQLRKYNLTKTEATNASHFADPLPDPLELLESKELEKILEQALESLPERCRIIFTLKRFAGLSHKEIATKLNISLKTVEAQITIAGKKLHRFVVMYWKVILLFILLRFII